MFADIESAVEDLKNGKMIIVVDDEDRENEGDLLGLAELADGAMINFMAKEGRGLICVPIEENIANRLNLHAMIDHNTDSHGTAFTVSIDHISTTTGISAFERADTTRALVDEQSVPADFKRPGHVFPLIAKAGGVLRRTGHTEAAVDFAKLAGAKPAGVICEIMNEDGTMARLPELEVMAEKHGLKIVTIEQLVAYRRGHESLIRREADIQLPTAFGKFRAVGYEEELTGQDHVALVKGDISGEEPVLVRVHSECLTGDIFGSHRCDCGPQLHAALHQIEEEGRGVLLYMRQEGRGIGLINKLKAYELQEQGYDTVEANVKLGFKDDLRDYGIGAQILQDLGISKMKLLTNNPRKITGLKGYGIEVTERVPIEMIPNADNRNYLQTKVSKLGHILNLTEEGI
ncbi:MULTISPECIES: bifunctional 3,4-dihydroxy-2-butanone-4-phosphate synthase/GTP cyclohydrolase II [Bacillaceae]|uniref:Riboflavin biosynthesis protein RibBA n=1 Tax=Domibacillus aminovorans TaxID=29332 RepID=A0A177L569_9BACI|nr:MULTISPECIES: bifunctional 3,4-dihydroxy-2-butanone-4-phosphate synthase/GTP cyclohydrolase II [Bacillaceae]OAH52890.1 3,4-dihydroxy-2-butanone 4-phosphate synthase [Domibacillus aminovorans]OAH60818.1 3,4-dihydroxy-2-butanone 4-phosphate synthase [Domibacillus aminovorans]